VGKRGPTKLLTQAKLGVPSAFQKEMLSLLNLSQKDNYVPGKGSSIDAALAAVTTIHITVIMRTHKSCVSHSKLSCQFTSPCLFLKERLNNWCNKFWLRTKFSPGFWKILYAENLNTPSCQERKILGCSKTITGIYFQHFWN